MYDLFNGRIQFIVPVYQRAYVWNEEENGGALWEDIADTAGRYIVEPTAHVRQRHFLGPIVLDQQPVEPGGVDPRLVIDGQQRLTMCVPKTSSTSCGQAVFVDQATDAGLSSDAVLVEVDRFGQRFQRRGAVK